MYNIQNEFGCRTCLTCSGLCRLLSIAKSIESRYSLIVKEVMLRYINQILRFVNRAMNYEGWLLILSIIYSLMIMWNCYDSSNHIDFIKRQYHQVLDNWSQNPIVDIQLRSDCNLANQTHFAQNLVEYNFSGTRSGCDCRHISFYSRSHYDLQAKIYNEQCTYNMTRAYCHEIAATPSHRLDRFFNQSQVLCAVRIKDSSYLSKMQDCYASDCDRSVWKGQVQKPITQITQKNNSTNHSQEECVAVSWDSKLCWQKGDVNPIAEFRVNELAVCLDQQLQNIHPDRTDHTLSKIPRSNCKGDTSFNKLTSTSEYHFFALNDLLHLESIVPTFSLSHTHEYSIFYRGYIGWQCNNEDLKTFLDVQNDDVFKFDLNTVVDISLSILLIVTCILAFNDVSVLKIRNIDVSIVSARVIIYAIMIWHLKSYVRSIKLLHDELGAYVSDERCFSEPSNSHLEDSIAEFLGTVQFIRISLSFTYVLLIADIGNKSYEFRRNARQNQHYD